MLHGEKLLVTGATGNVGLPTALGLAKNNEVWAIARFSDPAARAKLDDAGVHTVSVDLVDGDLSGVPDDCTYVLNFAVMKTNDWGRDLDGNAGGTATLMHHCRKARAFLHCSSTAVYQPDGHRVFKEDDPLGDNHRVWGFLSTYSICKISAEATARWCARALNLPTIITRLNVPYGDTYGWPLMYLEMLKGGAALAVHVDAPSVYNPIHQDDILGMLPALLGAASVPATTVNWGGSEPASIEEWGAYFGTLIGVEPTFVQTDQTIGSVTIDTTKMHEITGRTNVHWKDGFRRLVETMHPDWIVA